MLGRPDPARGPEVAHPWSRGIGEKGRKFVINQGITWPNLYDLDGSTKSTFGIGVPVTWYINSESKIVHKHIGVLKSKDELFSDAAKYLGVKL